jgi:hypothetical protein
MRCAHMQVSALPSAAGDPPCVAHGAPLPPAVIAEAGESVGDWARCGAGDIVMVAHTLVQVCTLHHSLCHEACVMAAQTLLQER